MLQRCLGDGVFFFFVVVVVVGGGGGGADERCWQELCFFLG